MWRYLVNELNSCGVFNYYLGLQFSLVIDIVYISNVGIYSDSSPSAAAAAASCICHKTNTSSYMVSDTCDWTARHIVHLQLPLVMYSKNTHKIQADVRQNRAQLKHTR